MKTINQLGWNLFFQNQFIDKKDPSLVPARVLAVSRNRFLVDTSQQTFWAFLPGKSYYQANESSELPTVGDWVLLNHTDQRTGSMIEHCLQRKSQLVRKASGNSGDSQSLAANVDTIFLLTSLNQDLNINRLERALLLAWDSQANPVILLSKSDLCEDVEEIIQRVEQIAIGVPIHPISALEDQGIEALEGYLGEGKTSVVIGSSGVGKSTLVNRLLGTAQQKTKQVREHDDRGVHTTTNRELFFLPSGGMIIDTPGLREWQLLENQEGLAKVFSDVEDFIQNCRFSNCQHKSEPGCGIRQAIDDGALTPKRFAHFQKLQREIAYQMNKQDRTHRRNRVNAYKKITKAYRQKQKFSEHFDS